MGDPLCDQALMDNVELYRRVQELEELDRQRLRRIAMLKLEVERLTAAPALPVFAPVMVRRHG